MPSPGDFGTALLCKPLCGTQTRPQTIIEAFTCLSSSSFFLYPNTTQNKQTSTAQKMERNEIPVGAQADLKSVVDVNRVVVGQVVQFGVVVHAHVPVQLSSEAARVDGRVERLVASRPGGVESLNTRSVSQLVGLELSKF
jgi:hypothetical protein